MKTLLRCMALQPPRFQEVAERLASNQTPCPLSPFKLAPGVTTTNALVAAELLSYMRGERATPEARTPKRIESSDRYKNRRTMLQLRDTHYTSSGFMLHLRVVHGILVEASSSAEAEPESLPSDGRRLIVMKALDWINSIIVYEIKGVKGFRFSMVRMRAAEEVLRNLDENGHVV